MSRILLPRCFLSPRAFVFLLLPLLQAYADERPIYVIGHNVNTPEDVDEAIKDGANAIQSDVAYSNNGYPHRIQYRGNPYCNCNKSCDTSEEVDTFLRKLAQFTNPHDPNFKKNLTLIMLYNNLENINLTFAYTAGRSMAEKLENNYWEEGGKANILLIIPNTKYREFFEGFRDSRTFSHRMKYVGFDVANGKNSRDQPLPEIHAMYSQMGIRRTHVWQSDCVKQCLDMDGRCKCNDIDKDLKRLKEAVEMRDGSDPYMVKVWGWALDRKYIIRRVLREKVDGVKTDFLRKLIAVLQEPEFTSKFRIATLTDSPWERYEEN